MKKTAEWEDNRQPMCYNQIVRSSGGKSTPQGVIHLKKHIVCYGDSNTHGYCADPSDSADGGIRFNEDERWPCLLQKALGSKYQVIEEGLNGRTTVFHDPVREGMSGLDTIYPCLMSHKSVDLLILMLGVNDTKERYCANPTVISLGLERLVEKAKAVPAWAGGRPNILIISPAHIGEGIYRTPGWDSMGAGCAEKSRELAPLFAAVAERQGCAFLDAEGIAECNEVDFMHLSRSGHAHLAEKLAKLVPGLL